MTRGKVIDSLRRRMKERVFRVPTLDFDRLIPEAPRLSRACGSIREIYALSSPNRSRAVMV